MLIGIEVHSILVDSELASRIKLNWNDSRFSFFLCFQSSFNFYLSKWTVFVILGNQRHYDIRSLTIDLSKFLSVTSREFVKMLRVNEDVDSLAAKFAFQGFCEVTIFSRKG